MRNTGAPEPANRLAVAWMRLAFTIGFCATAARWTSVREMSRMVWCRVCGHALEHFGGALPDACKNEGCQVTPAQWSTEEIPKVKWQLARKDRLFLRAIRIDPEDADQS